MQISDDHLIAYLLGDAPTILAEEIDRQLAVDSELLERLNHFRMVLGHIDSMHGIYEPPSDLVEQTLARIDEAESADKVSPADSLALTPSTTPSTSQHSLWDSTILTISLSLLCCMALPAIVRARFESRKAQCANNLRGTGFGLIEFALNDPGQRFPFVSLSGRNGFAGVYAVHLKSAGIPITPAQLQCASLTGCEPSGPSMILESIPTFSTLGQIAMTELALWQQAIGGDYAYNLGVLEDQKIVAPRHEGRTHFAILSDSPVFLDQQEEFIAHEGRGLNILYENGRVVFVSAPSFIPSNQGNDYPFRNLQGVHAVGLTRNDASLAPSHFSPLGN